jgi:hypothetical protein
MLHQLDTPPATESHEHAGAEPGRQAPFKHGSIRLRK